jgi:hypothetical protein
MTPVACLLASLVAWNFAPAPAPVNSHLWIVNEIYSNLDGTIQFVELWECCGSTIETQMSGKSLFVTSGPTFTFPNDLTGNTAHRFLLLGNAGYAALPGAPAPDFVLPDRFFASQGDTIRWWIYPNATLAFTANQLPVDGIHSLNHDHTTGINSPTNYAGQSGSVSFVASVPALPRGALIGLVAGAVLVGALVLRRSTPRA